MSALTLEELKQRIGNIFRRRNQVVNGSDLSEILENLIDSVLLETSDIRSLVEPFIEEDKLVTENTNSSIVQLWMDNASPIASGGTSNDQDDFGNNGVNNGTLSGTVTTQVAPTFGVAVPKIVIGGDSISKGNPLGESRIEDSVNTIAFDPNNLSNPGQPAYHLAIELGCPVLNMGNGGEELEGLIARFERDILGQTVTPAPDLAGTNTIPYTGTQAGLRDVKPILAVIISGINDVANDEPASEIQADFIALAEKIRANSVNAIICTIGPWDLYTAAEQVVAQEVNVWLRTEFLELYPEIQLFDYAAWATKGTDGVDMGTKAHTPAFPVTDGYIASLYEDSIHPSDAGYAALAKCIARQCRFKTKIVSLELEMNATVGAQPNYSLIDSADINGVAYTRPGSGSTDNTNFSIPVDMSTGFGLVGRSSYIWTIEPTAYTTLHGTGANIGFTAGFAVLTRPN